MKKSKRFSVFIMFVILSLIPIRSSSLTSVSLLLGEKSIIDPDFNGTMGLIGPYQIDEGEMFSITSFWRFTVNETFNTNNMTLDFIDVMLYNESNLIMGATFGRGIANAPFNVYYENRTVHGTVVVSGLFSIKSISNGCVKIVLGFVYEPWKTENYFQVTHDGCINDEPIIIKQMDEPTNDNSLLLSLSNPTVLSLLFILVILTSSILISLTIHNKREKNKIK